MSRKHSGLYAVIWYEAAKESKKGIEMMVNLINISYCAMKLLPYVDKEFAD